MWSLQTPRLTTTKTTPPHNNSLAVRHFGGVWAAATKFLKVSHQHPPATASVRRDAPGKMPPNEKKIDQIARAGPLLQQTSHQRPPGHA